MSRIGQKPIPLPDKVKVAVQGPLINIEGPRGKLKHTLPDGIIARLDARNTASARVLEHLGMRREAHFVQNEFFKGEWSDELVYAMLNDEWRESGRV